MECMKTYSMSALVNGCIKQYKEVVYMDWLQVIQTVGFPIACVIACGFFIYKMTVRDKDEALKREEVANAREEKLIEANVRASQALDKVADTITESDNVNKELSETNRLLVEKIEGSLNNLNNNMDKVLEKLSK